MEVGVAGAEGVVTVVLFLFKIKKIQSNLSRPQTTHRVQSVIFSTPNLGDPSADYHQSAAWVKPAASAVTHCI